MKNAVAGKSSSHLVTIYDMLETKLRALESLLPMSFLRHEVKSEEMINLDQNPQILENHGVNEIELSDVTCNENETDILIGADFIGKLLPRSDDHPVLDSEQTVLSLHVNNASLRELWDIESLDIHEPTENVTKRKTFDEQLKEFHEKLTVLTDGRYEVKLPWKLDARANLPDN
ncbi:hypothetical protein AVEN_161837-1 [Araneus ventricosus]|uniref:Peptidase aspartic putative domain-containing protein n=1 Tax=Araneus ventricosus TaxID=182803 RepID=A0A4Y2JUY2_ARAVE|nr:hypothetical protein AVEN_161837-1 [Araneus ventricosus]